LMAPGMPAAGIRRPTARSGGLGTRDLMSPGMPPAGMRRSTAMPGALGTRDLMAPGGMRRPGVAGRRGREGPEVRTVESSRYVWLDCECKAFQYTKLMKKVRARQANVGAREGRPGKIELAFLVEDRQVRQVRQDIETAVRQIRAKMRDTEAEAPKVKDHLGALKRRYEEPPVLSSYSMNPFKPPSVRVREPLQLYKGQKVEVPFKDIRIVEIVRYEPVNLDVKFDYDPEVGDSLVKIEARARSDAHVRLRDDQDVLYVLRVIVREEKPPLEPFPPLWSAAMAFRATEDEQGQRTPAKVLIGCLAYNPEQYESEYGITTHIIIERKLVDAPDEDYVAVTSSYPENILPALTIEQALKLRKEFFLFDETEETSDSTGMGGLIQPIRRPTGGGSAEPMAADVYDRQMIERLQPAEGSRRGGRMGAVGGAQQGIGLGELLRDGGFAFVDRTVDEGESYVYRIWTVAVSEGVSPTKCKESDAPVAVYIPAMVEFDFATVSSMGCTIETVRQMPGGANLLNHTFRVTRGQLIGGPIKVKEYAGGQRGGVGQRYRWVPVDFSTNAGLVTGLTRLRLVEYRLRDDWKNEKIEYRVRLRPEPRAVYLTRQNSLLWEAKSVLGRTRTEEVGSEAGRSRRLGGRRLPGGMSERLPGGRPGGMREGMPGGRPGGMRERVPGGVGPRTR